MCGIAGIFNKNNEDKLPFEIRKMLYLIKHRGNDSKGLYNDNNYYLGHLRLATMDMSSKCAQPISIDGRYWLAFNGDVYNFIEIKKELEDRGVKFFTNSDTEVVLHSFKIWGKECLKRFNGEWVFVIYDKEKKETFISNDRFSTKPFYYYHKENKFAFCSELKGFYGLTEGVEISENNILTNPIYLIESNCQTFFKHIHLIPPGHNLTFNQKTNTLKLDRWWNTTKEIPKISVNDKEQIEEYKDLFQNSCELRLRTDNTLGVSLSGGIDSSSVFGMLNKKFSNNKKNVNLNPIIFKSKKDDNNLEDSAIELCKLYNKKPIITEEIDYSLEDMEDLFCKIEMPMTYAGQVEIYKSFSKLGTNITLDGHGPDEALGGYPNDLNVYLIEYLNTIYNLKNAIIATWGSDKQWKNFIEKSKINYLDSIRTSPLVTSFDFNNLYNKNNYKNFENKEDFNSLIWESDLEDLNNFENPFQILYWRVHCGFMQWITHKWDKAAMSSTVSTRSPFLDYRLICFSLGLPSSKKIIDGQNKSILRRSMKNILPDYILENKLKKGLSPTNFVTNKKIKKEYFDSVVQDSSFQSNNLWNFKKIETDIKNKKMETKNLSDLTKLINIHLMIRGFKKIELEAENNKRNIINSNWLNFTDGNLLN